MKPKLLALSVIVVALVAGSVVVLSEDDSHPQNASVATVPPVLAAQTPSPTPDPVTALTVVWREVLPTETNTADFGTMFLLDTETGKIHSPVDATNEDGTIVHMEWRPDGGISVWIHKPGPVPDRVDALFVGEALGQMALVPGVGGQRVSSRGLAAVSQDSVFYLFDAAKQDRIGVLPLAPGQYPASWSWDGRYLSIHHDGDARRDKNPAVLIWDVETRQIVLEVQAHQIVWANAHNRFLYTVVDVSRGDNSLVETRVKDLTTGEDYAVGSLYANYWSPDDRYLLGYANISDRINAFSVFDARDGKKLITAIGSWPVAWVDEETIGLMADVCGGVTRLFYVQVDGSALRKVFDDVGWYGVTHPAPGGKKVAYTDYGDSLEPSNSVRVLTVASNVTQEFDVGRLYLMPSASPGIQTWSTDGRYLLLRAPVGKGGPCMGDKVVPFELIRHP